MLDLWEIFGRLVTDDDFRGAVFNGNFSGTVAMPYQEKNDTATPPVRMRRMDIPPTDYMNLRYVVSLKVAKPISLMALGEVVYAMTQNGFIDDMNKLAATLQQKFAGQTPPFDPSDKTPDFYRALGALVLDQNLLDLFVNSNGGSSPVFDTYGFGPLFGDDLQAVFEAFQPDAGEVGFSATYLGCQTVCDGSWVPDCNDIAVEWAGHTHPAANLQPPAA